MQKRIIFSVLLILAVFCLGMVLVKNRASSQDANLSVVDNQPEENASPKEKSAQPVVYYIPGLFSFDDPQEPVLDDLKNIFRDAQSVETYIWYIPQNLPDKKADSGWSMSFDIWEKSVSMAEDTAEKLFQEICKMSQEEQKNLILVGHSLGGRIVIRVLDKLNKKNLKIRQAILLGAAMDNNDPCIPNAIQASIETVYSFVNPTDKWLLTSIANVDRPMLGTGYFDFLDPKRFCEIQIDSTDSHDSSVYMWNFYSCCKNMKQNCIIVPQGYKNKPDWINSSPWRVVDSCQGWTLRTDDNDAYIVVDDLTLIRARGTKTVMTESFEKVKKQIVAGVSDGERESTKDFSNISVQQDEPVAQKLGSSKELDWRNKQNIKGWRLQFNIKTNKYRILDPSSHVRAQGSQMKMESAFKNIIILI